MIEQSNFHAGHRVSFKNGGPHSADNLIPLCGSCNMSMGRMNYDEYKATKMRAM
jgi:5-methylcytosine-specific restriction endonuclease McrA